MIFVQDFSYRIPRGVLIFNVFMTVHTTYAIVCAGSYETK